MMNLAIGTVQFGINYGVTNKTGKTPADEVKRIINYAREQNISVIDTSPAYGDSEKVLGDQDLDFFKIITKTAYIKNSKIEDDDITEMENALQRSLQLLGVDSIDGLFVHNTGDLRKEGNQRFFEKLKEFKERGLVSKIGVSVYDHFEIDELYSKYSFDMIQIPISVIDQRLVDTFILQELKRENIEIHARSIFLQGLLLNETTQLPLSFKGVFPLLDKYFLYLKENGMSKLEGALKYIHDIEEIDYAVVGINNTSQLHQINEALRKVREIKEKFDFSEFYCRDRQIIDPRKW